MSIAWFDDERSLLRIPFKAVFRKWLDSLEQHGPIDTHTHGAVVCSGATHVAMMSFTPAEANENSAGASSQAATTEATPLKGR